MSALLHSYLSTDSGAKEAPQEEWLTDAFRELVGQLAQSKTDEGWEQHLSGFRTIVQGWIKEGRVIGNRAAQVLSMADILDAAFVAEGRMGAATVLSFVMQMTMTDSQWDEYLQAAARDGVKFSDEGKDKGPLRIDGFFDAVSVFFIKRSRMDFLRALYRITHLRIDSLARSAMRDGKDFKSWEGDLALLSCHLMLRRWLPLKERSEDEADPFIEISDTGGRFVAPTRDDHEILTDLFDPDEIKIFHRKEAYAAECFAHLFTSLLSNRIDAEFQTSVADTFSQRKKEDRIGAHQWLIFGKSRFEIAPYI